MIMSQSWNMKTHIVWKPSNWLKIKCVVEGFWIQWRDCKDKYKKGLYWGYFSCNLKIQEKYLVLHWGFVSNPSVYCKLLIFFLHKHLQHTTCHICLPTLFVLCEWLIIFAPPVIGGALHLVIKHWPYPLCIVNYLDDNLLQ